MDLTGEDTMTNFENCPPRPDALIYSIRAFGYSLPMAVADLIDNSIAANSSNIWIKYSWNGGNPWVAITDDGDGMSEEQLHEAMRLGSRSPLETRSPEDLGRFGLGLKTASFSQCKLFSVVSKNKDGIISTRFWDLDHVRNTMEWSLGKKVPDKSIDLMSDFSDLGHGTTVFWEKLDRLLDDSLSDEDNEKNFLEKFIEVKKYVEMVFHQFLQGRRKKVSIFVGVSECEEWDPYLTKNSYTSELSSEKYEDSRVSILPYILPHVSNRTENESLEGAGINGWNAQQGFYVYRNGRMIVPGGYLDLDLKPDEHYKLARIRVDITNDMDHEWSIDVRKSIASPPDRLRGELSRIARVTRQRASDVYRVRTGRPRTQNGKTVPDTVWTKHEIRGKIVYRINKSNPTINKLIEQAKADDRWISKLFKVIETTVPHSQIIIDGLENEDCHVGLPEDLEVPSKGLLEICFELYREKRSEGRSHEEASQMVCSVEPFDSNPYYLAYLDRIKEGNNGPAT